MVITRSCECLDQSFTSKHGFPDFPDDICPITRTKQHDTPSSPAHTTRSTKTVNEIDRGMWDIIKNDMANGDGVDTS